MLSFRPGTLRTALETSIAEVERTPVCTENLSSGVVVVKSAKAGV